MTHMSEILLQEILKGVHAGGIKAIKKARFTNTNRVIWRDGKTIAITPDEAENNVLR